MPTTLAFKPLIDLPEWRPIANAPAASGAGTQLVAGYRNNSDRGAYVYLLSSATALWAYDVEDDDWMQLASPALAGTFGAGAGAVMMPSQGPRGTLAAGNTTNSIVLNTALPAAVAPNQLANKGNSNGFKIRIIGNSAGGSGKVEERYILGNTGGTTPTVYLDSPLSFTPASGDGYEILSGRLYLLNAGTLAANIWKCYDIATNSFISLNQVNLPATIGTDSSFIALDESYVPYDANPGDGYFGQLTATGSGATSITGTVAGADAAVLLNEYRNFQIRIVQDTGTPTAVGQRRSITSHTAGASPVYTVPTWTVTPSANAVFVIENNGDRILLWTSAQQSTYTYNIGANGWDTATFATRGAAVGAGCVSCPSFFMRPEAAKQARHSYIYSFRGGNVGTLDLFDIAGGANGAWSLNITYGGSGGVLFTTGTSLEPDPYTSSGRFAFINPNGGQRMLKFDVKHRIISPAFFLRYPSGTAAVGERMASAMFVDGSTKLVFLILQRMGGAECFQLAVQK